MNKAYANITEITNETVIMAKEKLISGARSVTISVLVTAT